MEKLYDERENLTNKITSMESALMQKDTQIEGMSR